MLINVAYVVGIRRINEALPSRRLIVHAVVGRLDICTLQALWSSNHNQTELVTQHKEHSVSKGRGTNTRLVCLRVMYK